MELTVVIREADEQTLRELAETQWRSPEQQASAMLEQALRAQKARSDPMTIHRTRGRRASAAA